MVPSGDFIDVGDMSGFLHGIGPGEQQQVVQDGRLYDDEFLVRMERGELGQGGVEQETEQRQAEQSQEGDLAQDPALQPQPQPQPNVDEVALDNQRQDGFLTRLGRQLARRVTSLRGREPEKVVLSQSLGERSDVAEPGASQPLVQNVSQGRSLGEGLVDESVGVSRNSVLSEDPDRQGQPPQPSVGEVAPVNVRDRLMGVIGSMRGVIIPFVKHDGQEEAAATAEPVVSQPASEEGAAVSSDPVTPRQDGLWKKMGRSVLSAMPFVRHNGQEEAATAEPVVPQPAAGEEGAAVSSDPVTPRQDGLLSKMSRSVLSAMPFIRHNGQEEAAATAESVVPQPASEEGAAVSSDPVTPRQDGLWKKMGRSVLSVMPFIRHNGQEEAATAEPVVPESASEEGSAISSDPTTQRQDGLLTRAGRFARTVVPFGRQEETEVTGYWVARDRNMSPETLVRRITAGTIDGLSILHEGTLPIQDALRRGDLNVVRAIISRLSSPETGYINADTRDPGVFDNALQLVLGMQGAEDQPMEYLAQRFQEYINLLATATEEQPIDGVVVDAIHLFIVYGAIPTVENLHFLIRQGMFDLRYLEVLLKNHPDVFTRIIGVGALVEGRTLVHLLVERDMKDHLRLVLKNTPDPSSVVGIVNQAGQMPLMLAIENGKEKVAGILLSRYVTNPDDLNRAETLALQKRSYTIVNMIRDVRSSMM